MNLLDRLARKLSVAMVGLGENIRIQKKCSVRGTTVHLSITSRREYERSVSFSDKEPETLSWIDSYLHPGEVMYDVGANIGQYSLYAALKHKKSVRIYAFEPESQNFAALNRNIYINELSACVIPVCLAITDRARVDSFYIHLRLRAGEAIHQFGVQVDHHGRPFVPVHTQGMIGLSLDDLCFGYGLEFPNHLKIDVDGLETHVLRGGVRTLRDSRVRSVLIELTESEGGSARAEDNIKWLESAGLKFVGTAPAGICSSQRRSENVLFVR